MKQRQIAYKTETKRTAGDCKCPSLWGTQLEASRQVIRTAGGCLTRSGKERCCFRTTASVAKAQHSSEWGCNAELRIPVPVPGAETSHLTVLLIPLCCCRAAWCSLSPLCQAAGEQSPSSALLCVTFKPRACQVHILVSECSTP